MKKKNKKATKKQIVKHSIICMISVFLIIILNVIILKNDLFTPKINEITTSYVTLYNQDTTDMLKITNIEKMSDEKGKSKFNKKGISFTITDENKEEYITTIYEIQNDIPKEYIKIMINDKISTLDKFEKAEDGGINLYTGKSKDKKMKIKMWVSDKYKKRINDTSFEIRIKKR